jgi:hypothetical protein
MTQLFCCIANNPHVVYCNKHFFLTQRFGNVWELAEVYLISIESYWIQLVSSTGQDGVYFTFFRQSELAGKKFGGYLKS